MKSVLACGIFFKGCCGSASTTGNTAIVNDQIVQALGRFFLNQLTFKQRNVYDRNLGKLLSLLCAQSTLQKNIAWRHDQQLRSLGFG